MANTAHPGGFVLAPPALGGVLNSTSRISSDSARDQPASTLQYGQGQINHAPTISEHHGAGRVSGVVPTIPVLSSPTNLGQTISGNDTSTRSQIRSTHTAQTPTPPPSTSTLANTTFRPRSSNEFRAPQPLHTVPKFNDFSTQTYTPPSSQTFNPPKPINTIPRFSPPTPPSQRHQHNPFEDSNTMEVIYEPTTIGHTSTATINDPSIPLILSTPPMHHSALPGIGASYVVRPPTQEELDDLEKLRVHEKEVEKMRRKEAERLVMGLDNADLNAMIRSFDKAVHNVKIVPAPYDDFIPKGLDLQPSPYEEFNMDKMRSVLERFYAGIGVGMIRALKEVQRIRNWDDGGRRTGVTMAIYVLAWWNDLIITTLLLFFSALILFPKFRSWAFQPPNTILHLPANPSALDPHGPLTLSIPPPVSPSPNAPSNTESKASDFADKIQSFLTSLSTGGVAGSMGNAQGASQQINDTLIGGVDKKGQQGLDGLGKRELLKYTYLQPGMRIVGGLADKWERFANAIEPTPPFLLKPRRFEVAAILLAPIFLMTTFVTAQMISKGLGAGVGIGMFAQPVITWTIDELDRRIPDWKEKLILEYNILEDVPTNAQLVLRLLRDAEHKLDPLPPATSTPEGLITHANETDSDSDSDDEDSDDESDEESQEGTGANGLKGAMDKVISIEKKAAGGLRSKVRDAWDKTGRRKEEGFALVTGHKEVNHKKEGRKALKKLRIKEDGKIGKTVLSKLKTAPDENAGDHASRFYVHHEKHGAGHLIIHPPTVPAFPGGPFVPARLEFTTIRHVTPSTTLPLDPHRPEIEPARGHLVISINDLVSMEKWGMNWTGRILTSWALDAEGSGGTGLIIKIVRRDAEGLARQDKLNTGGLLGKVGLGKEKEVMGVESKEEVLLGGKEEEIKFKGIVRRNELFDRLIAIGEQRWELL